jgi:hypothetical protein
MGKSESTSFEAKWNEVYDFVEFTAKYFPSLDKDGFAASVTIGWKRRLLRTGLSME